MMPWWSNYWEYRDGVLIHSWQRALWFWEQVSVLTALRDDYLHGLAKPGTAAGNRQIAARKRLSRMPPSMWCSGL
jgi:hypothetical protein